MSVTPIGGPKDTSELEQRRQALSDTRLARLGELADARNQVAGLEGQIARLEGGIIELGRILEQNIEEGP